MSKQDYDPNAIGRKWQEVWEKNKTFSPDLANAKKPYYTLMMFPYPSAEGLHVGNMYAFTGSDVYARFMRMSGFDVFEPIGLDGFGIHSENYAIKVGRHPAEQVKISQKNFYRQLRATGNSYDWTRTLETYDPDYYRWTQWIFVQMFKKGLAYRKKAQVNWCPSDKTVLADEQVIEGRCERDGAQVEKRDLEQWFFKITEYADRLLAGLSQIDWPEKIKIAQRQWIGKSQGIRISFVITRSGATKQSQERIEVFTTRADTLYGATFLVVAPEHPFAASIKDKEVQDYIRKAKGKTDSERMENKQKTGVFSGLYAINPLNKEKIPVWIADYAVMGYGTGALFGDAHDERDAEFAHKYNIPLKPTLITGDPAKDRKIKSLEEVYTGYGTLFNSGPFSGQTSQEAIKKISDWLDKDGFGGHETTYHLRDWLISRQRYWGPPIPMIFCSACQENSRGERSDMPGWWTVPEGELPVELPDVEDWRPQGTGRSPLANHPEFYNVACPECGGAARRETDVSDTFLDSAWYYLRYLSIGLKGSDKTPYDIEIVKKWCPASIYIGGAEHSVLHLLYVRFIAMVLHDLNSSLALPYEEPFPRFFAHGLIIKERAKMSKSRGNIVVPDEYIAKFGADTVRMYLMFLGQFSEGGDFRDTGIEGMNRFIKRLWKLLNTLTLTENDQDDVKRMINKTIKSVTEDLEKLSYNTAIARLMEFYNFAKDKKGLSKETILSYLKLIAPFAPFMTEELYEKMGLGKGSIHFSVWPTYNKKYLVKNEVVIPIQVNGKRRGEISIEYSVSSIQYQKEIEEKAREEVRSHLEGKTVRKVVYVPGRIINFVVSI